MSKKAKKLDFSLEGLSLSERIAARDKLIDEQIKISGKAASRLPVLGPAAGPVAAARSNLALMPYESKGSRTAVVSTWNTPPSPTLNYERISREGYGANEVVYACVEELCTSAAEPVLRAFNGKIQEPDDHPILQLLAQPNPFLTGYDYIASLLLFRSLAGNAYTEKVFSRRTDSPPAELWLIRPDRMQILPDPVNMVGGYRFQLGNLRHDYPVEEIGHYKIRNPLDQRYGLPPMSVLLRRVDSDNNAREFTRAFFHNQGVPSTLLAFKSLLDEQDRNMISSRFRRDYGGEGGWHNVMVTEANEVDVKQLGMPMGARGIAYPELDEIHETRICMVFGVPQTLVGARLSQKSGSYANRASDREMFWNETLVPIYRELESSFKQWLIPHYPDITHLKFDLTTVNAFADETDVLHARTRNNWTQSLIGFRESRKMIGLEDDPDAEDIMLVPKNMTPMKFKDFAAAKDPAPIASSGNSTEGDTQNENGNDSRPNPVARRNGVSAH